MTAVNAGVHELAGVRLPLQPYPGAHAVFMYSTAADGNVTLQLKEPDDLDRTSLAAMLARLQDDASFSISYQDTDILSDGSIDVLLGTGTGNVQGSSGNETVTATFDLFDSSSGPDLTLSPQTFTNSAEAFINDNSNSLGVPADNDAVSSSEDKKVPATSEVVKLTVKRARPKAASPNRQGPQQCQVCAKVFGNASALAKHKLTHSDERKYVCTMCGKAFKRQDHLNGHMLTHRNKKPYECKAEGCGKSYCDARSLRRHTENHHSSSSVNAATTMSPAQGAASGDAASPHGSSCIQYAPPPSTPVGKSQLQQLLATEPAKGGGGGSNDGLTKQQLDLIHQIMEQTQRQSQSSSKSSAKPTAKPVSKTPVKVQRIWTSAAQQNAAPKTNASASSPQSKVSSTTSSNTNSANASKTEPKPVECNLCHRKFKNIPALNGHMRLHGGYFKKDTDNKKCEKKDASGPPLQTASVSVRALIEEKIINKRITNPQTPTPEEVPRSSAPPLFPLTVHSSATSSDIDSKLTSFVVPAPPQHTAEKARRHSDAEAFTVPRTPSTQQEAEALADLILKREKVSVKRTTSDPGQTQQQQQQQQQIIQFQSGDSFTLTGVTYQSEDGGYLSPSIQDEVFTQVQDTMLLQSVDAQQLSSIQFQTEGLLQDHADQQLQDIVLDDYSHLQDNVVQSPSYQSNHSVNQELQAVLDSPLPESLAEFSTFHSTTNIDMPSPGYQTQSPVQYSGSPHTSLAAQSPLQSPLIRHDSPGFAYPTPPASHEGQSPCFGQNSILPMVSPKQNEYNQIVNDAPQNSLLAADFFSTTMSSSAAVEEALEEVLPGENIEADDLYPSLTNSPPPQSPISVGLTPVPSPLSNIPSSSASSPHPQSNNFVTSQTASIQFPHYTLQSQMMPNSDDPLLSSSPKDFQAKKRFEFNGFPLKVISSNGILDNANFAGILLDTNGEIKLIQTGGNTFQAKNIVLTAGLPIVTAAAAAPKEEDLKTQKHFKIFKATQTPAASKFQMKPKCPDGGVKQPEETNDVFLSPTIVPASPVRVSRKRPRSEPLQLPVLHHSRLRATRSKPQGAAPYTPLPILNPTRQGCGLYWSLKQKMSNENFENQESTNNWNNESIPETDSTPHINVGPQFQCAIPSFIPIHGRRGQEANREDLLWDPGISGSSDLEVDMYLDFACCAAIPGGGRNKEYAMHVLHLCGGNIHDAMLKIMQPAPSLPFGNPLHQYQYNDSDKWTASETEIFHQALLKYDKDFTYVAQEIGSKTVKQCVQFYYVWKKVCVDEYRRMKQGRDRKNGCNKGADSDHEEKPLPDARLLGIADAGSPMPLQDHRNFICEFADCSASFNSRAALNGHIRIHGGTARNSPTRSQVSDRRPPSVTPTLCHSESPEDYPCKICGNFDPGAPFGYRRVSMIAEWEVAVRAMSTRCQMSLWLSYFRPVRNCCRSDILRTTREPLPPAPHPMTPGRVFTKIKSRSAHMKSHRPPDAEPAKRRDKDAVAFSSSNFDVSATSPFST